MSKIKVIARPGLQVPREDNARKYINDKDVFEVEESAYYHRRLREGDLILTKTAALAPAEVKNVADKSDTAESKGAS